jgi:hypothetical protein
VHDGDGDGAEGRRDARVAGDGGQSGADGSDRGRKRLVSSGAADEDDDGGIVSKSAGEERGSKRGAECSIDERRRRPKNEGHRLPTHLARGSTGRRSGACCDSALSLLGTAASCNGEGEERKGEATEGPAAAILGVDDVAIGVVAVGLVAHQAREDAGILERHDFRDGRSRYEEVQEAHHDHLIDVATGSVIEFRNEEIEKLQRRVAEELGFELIDHRLELYGVPKGRKPPTS